MGRVSGGTLGLVAVGSAAALWAAAAAVASELFDRGVSPLELVEARAIVAAAGLGVIALVNRFRAPSTAGDHPPVSPTAGVVALGLALALVNLVYYLAIDRLAVAVAIVLQYSAPALVVLWGALVARRRPSRSVVIALGVALAGLVLVSEVLAGDLGRIDAFGIAMGLASAVLFAAYTLLSEPVTAALGPVRAMFRAFAVASAFWIVIQLPRGWPDELFAAGNLLPVLFIGLAGTLLPFLLYVWGVTRIQAERASIAATLEPVLAAVFAWLWLSQSLSSMQIGGGILVIVAVGSLQATNTPEVEPAVNR